MCFHICKFILVNELTYLKLFVAMRYVNKAAKTLVKKRFIPGGFPMCSLFHFFHMFTLVKHIIQIGVPLSSLTKSWAFGCSCVTQKYMRHSSRRPQIIVQFHKTPKNRSPKQRCEETSVLWSNAERVKLQKRSKIFWLRSESWLCEDSPAGPCWQL